MMTKSILSEQKHLSIQASIDNNFIKRLSKFQLSLDMYLILNTVNSKQFETYNIYDEIHPIGKDKFQYLLREGYIQCEDNNYDIYSIELTSKALDMFKEDDDSIDNWITEWRDLWPKGVTSGGYPVRADAASITKKMKAFVKKHGYDKDKIITITKEYIAEKEAQNWAYIKTAA